MTTRDRDQAICRWCREPIVVVRGMYGSSWAHKEGHIIPCARGGVRDAEPALIGEAGG